MSFLLMLAKYSRYISFLLHFICYIKKCHLLFRPKPSCTNVQPRFISHLRWSAVKRLSPVKVWSPSRTSWHTWSIRFAVILRKWLCLNVIKPPFLLDKLCWRSYFAPQLHIFGKHDNGHLYRIFTRSQNSFSINCILFLLVVELIAT